MKKKQILALLLSISISVTSITSVVFAEEAAVIAEEQSVEDQQALEEPQMAQFEVPSASQEIAASAEQMPEAAQPEEITSQAEEVAEQLQTDESVQTEEMSETAETVATDEGIASNDDKKAITKTAGVTPFEDWSEDDALEAAVKENFLKIVSISAIRAEGEICVELVIQNQEYDTLYFGKIEDKKREPVFVGEENDKGGYTFTFVITPDLVGKIVPYIPGKQGAEWYTDHALYLKLPEEVQEEEQREEDTGAGADDKIASEYSKEGEKHSETDTEIASKQKEVDPALFLTEEVVDAGIEESVLFLADDGALKDAEAVDNSTDLTDGTYTPDEFIFTGGTGKMQMVCSKVTVKDGKAYADIVLESDSVIEAQWAGGSLENDGNAIKNFTIPVALNVNNELTLLTTAMSEPHYVDYTIMVKLGKASSEEEEKMPEDGTYRFDFDKNENAVELAEGYKMFRVIACTMTVKDGKMTAILTLNGTGYDYLYPGTADEALAASADEWIPFVKDSNGKYTYTIPVEKLDEVVVIAGRSASYAAAGAAQPWYNKGLIFHSEAMVKVDASNSDDPKTNAGESNNTDSSGNNGKTNTGNTGTSGGSGNGKTGNSTGNVKTGSFAGDNSAGGSSTGGSSAGGGGTNGSTGAVNTSTGLKDGDYTPDSFSWSGGTGKLSISCSKITVSGGKTYATIVFSSGKITYVKADGNQYNPLSQTSDSSTFEIPVQLNANNKILACTTAMSQPHEVEYTLYIGLEAAKKASLGDTSGISASSKGGSGLGASSGNAGAADGSELEKLADAPQIAGLEYQGTAKNEYAKYFRLQYYENGFRVLEISLSDEEEPDWSDRTEEGDAQDGADESANVRENTYESTNAQGSTDGTLSGNMADAEEGGVAEQKSLYEGTVLQYLIAPEGEELPAGIDKDMIVVQLPAEKVYVDSSTALKMLDKLGLTEQISAVGMSGKECESDSVVRAMADGAIENIGHYDETSIYKALVTSGTKIAIVPADILQKTAPDDPEDADTNTVQESYVQDIGDSMNLLKIPMIIDRADDEKEQLAKYEWLKVYAAIFDCEKEAGEVFQAAEDALKKDTSGQKTEAPNSKDPERN